jgi:hypothetical protein
MHESTIARVLAGEVPAEELEREDVEGGALVDDFDVEPEMLLRLVDAAERGAIAPETLQGVAKAILDSDRFGWGYDEPIYPILYEWSKLELDLADARRYLAPRPFRDLPFVVGEEVKDLGPGFRVALGVCAGVVLVCLGVMFLGGSNFAEGTLGRHVIVIGMGFFAIMFVLVFAAAKS